MTYDKPFVVRSQDKEFIPASHEDPIHPGVLKKVLLSGDMLPPGNVRMVNWALMGSGKEFSPHYHEDMAEVFVITGGQGTIVINRQWYQVSRGDLVYIPENNVHSMKNSSREPLEYIAFGISQSGQGKTVNV